MLAIKVPAQAWLSEYLEGKFLILKYGNRSIGDNNVTSIMMKWSKNKLGRCVNQVSSLKFFLNSVLLRKYTRAIQENGKNGKK